MLLGVTVTALLAGTSAAAFAAAPIRVTTSITPDWIYFADKVTARIHIVIDRTQVEPGSIQVTPSFTPWEQSGTTRTTTIGTGTTAVRTIVYSLRCIDFSCLPKGTVVQRFYLPIVVVTAQTDDGASVIVRKPWPPVNVAGRFLPPLSGSVRPGLTLETADPAPRYAVPPATTALVIDAVAAVLGLAALGLVLVELFWWVDRRRHPVDLRPPLVRALDLMREARTREPDDRRRAAALVARLLPTRTDERSRVTEVAWSERIPSPDELEAIAEELESSLTEKR